MAIIDGTMVERPPGDNDAQIIDPTSYLTAVKGLLKKGVWPNKCSGPALQDKLVNYNGNMSLCSPANKKRQSYYATTAPQDDVVTTVKSRCTWCRCNGKFSTTQISN